MIGYKPPNKNILFAFVDLLRLRIVTLVIVSCAIGFVLSCREPFIFLKFFCTLLGTALLSSGACALNCYMERDADALMLRTCHRPIPSGIIPPNNALIFGISLILTGSFLIFIQVNMLAGLLGLSAVFIYLFVYTPAKRLTWLNTSIGALPGAIPPLIGWASATGEIGCGGWILFAMLFLWQHTHFFSIAWLYKDDYKKGGFCMLPVLESDGKNTFRLTIFSALALLPFSIMLHRLGLTGYAYLFGSVFFGFLLIAAAFRLSRQQSPAAARGVLLLSVFYIPVIFAAVILDRYGTEFGTHFYEWVGTALKWT